eukprot:355127-Chlamydomonas_euryale.AAC.27
MLKCRLPGALRPLLRRDVELPNDGVDCSLAAATHAQVPLALVRRDLEVKRAGWPGAARPHLRGHPLGDDLKREAAEHLSHR